MHKHKWRWHSEYTEDGIDCRLCAEEGYSPENWMDEDEVIRRLNAVECLTASMADSGASLIRGHIAKIHLKEYAKTLRGDDV